MLMQSVKIAESIGKIQLAASTYNALGALSAKQSDFISAKLWFEKSLSMYESLRDEEAAIITRRNLEQAIAAIEAARRKKEESP